MNGLAHTWDEIHIDKLVVFANHGVFPEETKLGQKFLLSMTLYVDTRPAGKSDDLCQSINYGEASAFAAEFTRTHTRKLIEAAAEDLAQAMLQRYELLKGITLKIEKPWAPVGLALDSVSVTITRFWHRAYIAMGSNMGDKRAYLEEAVRAMDSIPGCKVGKVSSFLVTAPYGGVEQDDFLNGCLELHTVLAPQELLDRLGEIEQAAHRERLIHWGPRTLDLDILMYDDLVMETETLVIPHVEMHLRDFVLRPLAEIAPWVRHPILKKTVSQLLAEQENENKLL